MQTGKCLKSFRHRHPVTTVAMSSIMCLSGCEGGKVKVWNLETGLLIKVQLRVCNENLVFLFLTKTYVVGTQKNRLNETVLLSAQYICKN